MLMISYLISGLWILFHLNHSYGFQQLNTVTFKKISLVNMRSTSSYYFGSSLKMIVEVERSGKFRDNGDGQNNKDNKLRNRSAKTESFPRMFSVNGGILALAFILSKIFSVDIFSRSVLLFNIDSLIVAILFSVPLIGAEIF